MVGVAGDHARARIDRRVTTTDTMLAAMGPRRRPSRRRGRGRGRSAPGPGSEVRAHPAGPGRPAGRRGGGGRSAANLGPSVDLVDAVEVGADREALLASGWRGRALARLHRAVAASAPLRASRAQCRARRPRCHRARWPSSPSPCLRRRGTRQGRSYAGATRGGRCAITRSSPTRSSMKPPPPMPQLNGSVTPSVAAAATAGRRWRCRRH